jgi:hypothetical protein
MTPLDTMKQVLEDVQDFGVLRTQTIINLQAAIAQIENAEPAAPVYKKAADRYQWLANNVKQEADAHGPIFTITVRRNPADSSLYDFGAAVDREIQRYGLVLGQD